MASSDAYVSVPEYRAAISKEDAADDLLIAEDLKAISRYLDRRTNRFFGQNGTSSEDPAVLYYAPSLDRMRRRGAFAGMSRYNWAEAENPWAYGGFARVLDTDDLVTVYEIAIDELRTGSFTEVLTTNDYELLPRNAIAYGGEQEPYNQIALTEWGSHWGWLPGSRIRIKCISGWPEVPGGIKRATIQLTAIWRLESPRATTRITELDQVIGMSRVGQNIVQDLIDQYGKVTF